MIADPSPEPLFPGSPPPPPAGGGVEYFAPLERAWQRMTAQLFRPFDLVKWLVLGFSCWLARLFEGGFGGGFNVPVGGGDWGSDDAEAATAFATAEGERSEAQATLVRNHHLVSLVSGDTIRYQGPFASFGESTLGS